MVAVMVLGNVNFYEIKVQGATPASDFEYYVNNNETITIDGYNGTAKSVIIPEKIDGIKVTSIGYGAFWYCTKLTSITLHPESELIDDMKEKYGSLIKIKK